MLTEKKSKMKTCQRKSQNIQMPCKDYVSLRSKASKSSTRLAKVPLGASVLAYPDEEQNGFILCVYQDEYGYILAEYLEPITAATGEPAAAEE